VTGCDGIETSGSEYPSTVGAAVGSGVITGGEIGSVGSAGADIGAGADCGASMSFAG